MHWIRTQNDILLNMDGLVRVDIQPKSLHAGIKSPWVITVYQSRVRQGTRYKDFQVVLTHDDMEESYRIFDEFVRWLSDPSPAFYVFDFSRWKSVSTGEL